MLGPLRLILALGLATGWWVVAAGPAYACSCAVPGSDAAAREGADAVFVGEVVARDDPGGKGSLISTGRPILYTFDIETVEKGDLSSQAQVITSSDGPACGVNFSIGQRYVVFAYEGKRGLTTNSCTNTRQLAEGETVSFGEPPRTVALVLLLASVGMLVLVSSHIYRLRSRLT